MMLTVFSFSHQRSVVVGLDVSKWGGSSLFSFDGANCSSPTAPLLTDPNTHTGHHLYPVSLSRSHTHTEIQLMVFYGVIQLQSWICRLFVHRKIFVRLPIKSPGDAELAEWSQSKIPQHFLIKLCLSTLILGLVPITPLPCRERQPEVQPIPDHGSPSTLTPVEWSGVALGSITAKVPLANLNTSIRYYGWSSWTQQIS